MSLSLWFEVSFSEKSQEIVKINTKKINFFIYLTNWFIIPNILKLSAFKTH